MTLLLDDLTGYRCRILKATGCPLDEATILEELMRHVILCSELDHLTPEAFDQAACTAYDTLRQLHGENEG